jgi:hypothetical protein
MSFARKARLKNERNSKINFARKEKLKMRNSILNFAKKSEILKKNEKLKN